MNLRSVYNTPSGECVENLLDMGVDSQLFNAAVDGGPILLRALYMFVLAESELHEETGSTAL